MNMTDINTLHTNTEVKIVKEKPNFNVIHRVFIDIPYKQRLSLEGLDMISSPVDNEMTLHTIAL